MTYDTTLLETLETKVDHSELPACLTRNRLKSEYFPQFTRSQLALVITLGVLFFWISIHPLHPTDLWGHLNFGRWIVQHQSLPALDPFSAEPLQERWVPSAWLAQVIGYETFELGSYDGLVGGHALLTTLAVGLMIGAIRARGAPLCWAISGGVAYYLLSLPIVGVIRPQLFGMVGAPLVLWGCALLPEKRHPLVWLPLVFLFWTNLHGSFVMGLAMLGLAAIGATWQVLGETRSLKLTAVDPRVMRFWMAVGLSIAAVNFNPLGTSVFASVLSFGGHAALASISEWRSLPLASLSSALFFSSLILAGVVFKLTTRRWELTDLLLLAVFGLATLSAMRMLTWWAAVWPWVVVPYALAAWEARVGRSAPPAPATGMRTVLALGFVFMTLLLAPPTNRLILGQPRGVAAATSPQTPIYIADEISRRHLQGTFFAPLEWADYLVWSQPDGLRPLAYSHVHQASPEVWQAQQALEAGADNWLKIVDEHSLRYLVINKQRNQSLAHQVMQYSRRPQSRAHVLYQDRRSLLVRVFPEKSVLVRPTKITAAR
jgi:hypothetical protein